MTLFNIHDSVLSESLRDKGHYETPEYIISDTEESFALHQLKRIIHRPLETKDPGNKKFTSWKGRFVCVIKFLHALVREPFRLLKNIVIVMNLVLVTILNLVNLPFSQNAREEMMKPLCATLLSLTGALLRPAIFAMDLLRLSGGALIHPGLAIRSVE